MWDGLRLEAKTLSCERGGRLIFKDLSFTVQGGEAVELRGPNGAGKSSLLRLLAGLNHPTEGSLTLTPKRTAEDPHIPSLSHYIGHYEATKAALSVKQNLDFWAKFLGGSAEAALAPLKMQRLSDDEARLLSEGQRRRLALSRLVAVQRPIWLLDEPTVGLDVTALADLRGVMSAHLAKGGMIIAATHAELGLKAARTLQIGTA